MGLIGRSVLKQAAYSPWDDFWYENGGSRFATNSAGVVVNEDTALAISTVFRCVTLISGLLGTCPAPIYEEDESGRRKAKDHPLYPVLNGQANQWQTSDEWIEMMTGHALLRGDGFSEIVPGNYRAVDQLIPLHPDRVDVRQEQNGEVRYTYRGKDGVTRPIPAERMFHLRFYSSDGIRGVSRIKVANSSFGETIATERYGARFFGHDARPSVVLKYPGQLDADEMKNIKDSWKSEYGGWANSGGVAVLEEGLDIATLGMSNEDAQFLDTRKHHRQVIAAEWFGVPLFLVGEMTNNTSWGTGIEQQALGFVKFTLLPLFRRWEKTIGRCLLADNERFYVEFLLEELLRGDFKSRVEGYQVAINSAWMSPQEARRKENMPAVDGLDVYLKPLNFDVVARSDGKPLPPPRPPGQAPSQPPMAEQSPQISAEAIAYTEMAHVMSAAARVLRKETAALARAAKRCGESRQLWEQAVREFYASHGGYVATEMLIDDGRAQEWCEAQQEHLLFYGAAIMETWHEERVPELAKLAVKRLETV